MSQRNIKKLIQRKLPPLKVGYVVLSDAAPLLVARELGIFERNGLDVELTRQVGWATIRDKIIYRELDAAHALSAMLFATRLGLGCPPTRVLTGLILNIHGNAITVSTRIPAETFADPSRFQSEVRRRRGEDRLTFGVVSPWSSHNLQLRRWLRDSGLDPDRDVRTAIVPPGQMCRNLAAGTIDGFCSGEPWNSLAVHEGTGRVVSCSAIDDQGHIEKVLMVREDFNATRPEEHALLIRSLQEACKWCDEAANREPLAEILSSPGALNLPIDVIRAGITGPFNLGDGRHMEIDNFVVFHRGAINTPIPFRGEPILQEMADAHLVPAEDAANSNLTAELFREDLFLSATGKSNSHEIQRL